MNGTKKVRPGSVQIPKDQVTSNTRKEKTVFRRTTSEINYDPAGCHPERDIGKIGIDGSEIIDVESFQIHLGALRRFLYGVKDKIAAWKRSKELKKDSPGLYIFHNTNKTKHQVLYRIFRYISTVSPEMSDGRGGTFSGVHVSPIKGRPILIENKKISRLDLSLLFSIIAQKHKTKTLAFVNCMFSEQSLKLAGEILKFYHGIRTRVMLLANNHSGMGLLIEMVKKLRLSCVIQVTVSLPYSESIGPIYRAKVNILKKHLKRLAKKASCKVIINKFDKGKMCFRSEYYDEEQHVKGKKPFLRDTTMVSFKIPKYPKMKETDDFEEPDFRDYHFYELLSEGKTETQKTLYRLLRYRMEALTYKWKSHDKELGITFPQVYIRKMVNSRFVLENRKITHSIICFLFSIIDLERNICLSDCSLTSRARLALEMLLKKKHNIPTKIEFVTKKHDFRTIGIIAKMLPNTYVKKCFLTTSYLPDTRPDNILKVQQIQEILDKSSEKYGDDFNVTYIKRGKGSLTEESPYIDPEESYDKNNRTLENTTVLSFNIPYERNHKFNVR